jgi:hypothetical protein
MKKGLIMLLLIAVLFVACLSVSTAEQTTQETEVIKSEKAVDIATVLPQGLWYTIQICDGIRALAILLIAVSTAMLIAGIIMWGFTPGKLWSEDKGTPDTFCFRTSYVICHKIARVLNTVGGIVLIIASSIAIFLPSKETLIAQVVTTNIPNMATDIRAFIDYVFSKIAQLK